MLSALLLTACSDSENEDPNGGGGTNTSKIVGLNIKDAKLIYGVEKASVKSMLKSSGSSNYFRQVTRGNQNMEVTWVTENGDTTSITRINVIANLNADHLIVGTSQYLGDDSGLTLENMDGSLYMGYIINKNTGKVINPDNPIISEGGTGGNIDWNDFTSFYNYDKHCYIKGKGCVIKVNLETSELTKMFEGADDIKIFSNGSFFVHMTDGKHKYGSLILNIIEEFSDLDRYRGWDNYIPVYGVVDGMLSIVCNKKNTDGTTTYTLINYSSGENVAEYGFSDQLDNPNYRLIADFELKPNIPIGGIILTPTSVNTSRTSQIIYIGTSNGRNGILINYDAWNGLTQLSNELINGFITGRERENPYKNFHPNIAVNSMASFNLKEDKDLVITEFSTLTQKTIKEAKGYRISGIIGKYKDSKPITFIGNNWEKRKQCVGTIDSEGNIQILQEFNYNDNESLNGFLLEL